MQIYDYKIFNSVYINKGNRQIFSSTTKFTFSIKTNLNWVSVLTETEHWYIHTNTSTQISKQKSAKLTTTKLNDSTVYGHIDPTKHAKGFWTTVPRVIFSIIKVEGFMNIIPCLNLSPTAIGVENKTFLWFDTVSLYGYICPALEPETMTHWAWISQFC